MLADKLHLVDQTLKGSYQISNVNVFETFLKEQIDFLYLNIYLKKSVFTLKQDDVRHLL